MRSFDERGMSPKRELEDELFSFESDVNNGSEILSRNPFRVGSTFPYPDAFATPSATPTTDCT